MSDLDFAVLAVNALTLACIYGTLAIGLSITWSSLGLINLAYGFTFVCGGYGAWLAGEKGAKAGLIMSGKPLLLHVRWA